MTEEQFEERCERALRAIEDAVDAGGLDIEASRRGPVLELEFEDGSKIIVNGNAPVRQVWVAARSGGFHFRDANGRWVDTRSGEELFESLSRLASQQAGCPVALKSPV